jgi:hypothetical protein
MDEAVDGCGGMVGVLAAGRDAQDLPGTYERPVHDEHFNALPLIEISDRDYRSFCWPCHALEEMDDCQ